MSINCVRAGALIADTHPNIEWCVLRDIRLNSVHYADIYVIRDADARGNGVSIPRVHLRLPDPLGIAAVSVVELIIAPLTASPALRTTRSQTDQLISELFYIPEPAKCASSDIGP